MGAIMAKEALSCLKIYLQTTDAPSAIINKKTPFISPDFLVKY
jgi:hypothetical protein